MDKSKPKTPDSIISLVMETREVLMEYFKGDCVGYVTDSNRISISPLSGTNGREFQYQRQNNDRECRRAIVLDNEYHLFTLSKYPYVAQLHASNFRSDYAKMVSPLLQFFANYLPGVDLQQTNGEPQTKPAPTLRIMTDGYVSANNIDFDELRRIQAHYAEQRASDMRAQRTVGLANFYGWRI